MTSFALRILLYVPAAVYAASYAYLAVYHGRLNLFPVVIHEGGTFTLWETALYASHFLGHIPVHIVAALLLLGAHWSFSGPPARVPRRSLSPRRPGLWLFVFLSCSVMLSLYHFGAEDTMAYVLQQKQGVDNYVPGGSWNLHLGSTVMLFMMIPLYVLFVRVLFRRPVEWSCSGWTWAGAALLLMLVSTALANGELVRPFVVAWTDPRYLAHSVRELATFPLICFPLPLYFLLRDEGQSADPPDLKAQDVPLRFLAALLLVFAVALAYQVLIPLQAGIGDLAQKPGFAKGGTLPILYLLASHYFEHFLDTVFFTLFTLWLAAKCASSRGRG